jgi:hypothetical protein
MSKWSKEKHGLEAIRPIAEKIFNKDPTKKSKIWSIDHEMWGRFTEQELNEEDEFLFWVLSKPGDRVDLSILDVFDKKIFGVILSIEKDKLDAKWKMKILLTSCEMIEIFIPERKLFEMGWQLFPLH